ncbi:hypothetical protein Ahy_A04g020141 [Arachis hypogaea]|uniref:Aminotransferase-like plant mobile domain-containing protein n=1 Tax=Arachis hypogaea TaxID=3818 RepID=A0A445DH53_ARAHY|nr:hypothetical protein Ahy_A04g020141 [Arachis hypogaea]
MPCNCTGYQLIGIVQCQKALVNALIERWHPNTHTFYLLVGECAVTLEDVAVIFGLPTNGLPVTGLTMSSFEALEAECLHQFGVAPRKSDCRGSFIKLMWLWDLKERLQLIDKNSIQRYVKCHIMFLFRTTLFGDNGVTGSVDTDAINILLLLTLGSDWMIFRKVSICLVIICFVYCVQVVWVAYGVNRIEPDIIPADIYMHSVMWSATHATNRFRQQFDFIQGFPHQEQTWMASKSKARMKDGFSNGCSFAKSIFSQITPFNFLNEIVNGITISNGFSQINFTPLDICNKI